MRRILALVSVLAAVGLTACGSSGGSTGSSTTTPSTKPADTAQGIADAALLTAADLPDGFIAGSRPGTDTDALLRGVPACDPFPALTTTPVAKSTSRAYSTSRASVSEQVKLFPSPTVPDRQVDELSGGGIVTCLADAASKGIEQRTGAPPLDSVAVSPVSVGDYGDASRTFRFTLHLGGPSPSVALQDQTLVQVGRATLAMRVAAATSAELARIETAVLPKLTDRLEQALG